MHDDGNSAPLSWASKKARRVARSTLTAETLAAVEAIDAAQVSKKILEEVLIREIPAINLYVDNKSLYDTASTSNVIADKRLMIDLEVVRDMLDRDELIMKLISSDKQLADGLTKSGVDRRKLTDVLSSGLIEL